MDQVKVHDIILPNEPLSNFQILDAVKGIPNFRGVYLRDELPKKAKKKECGIFNLADDPPGTHWVAWFKSNSLKIYFDSYGIQPPLEIIEYLGNPVYYSTDQIQPNGTVLCGHLCLYVLKELSKGKPLKTVTQNFL
jgi:hypothetical protein